MHSYTELPDDQLWQMVQAGNIHAFEALVSRHQSAVSAIAYGVCGDFTTSEDIAQETFLAAWRQRMDAIDSSKLKSWLCGIARNQALDFIRRKRAKVAPVIDGEVRGSEESASDRLIRDEEADLLRQALNELPEHYREPLILFYREEQSIEGVAASLDLSESAVKQRLARGREMLRAQVLEIIERALRSTRPTPKLTSRILSALLAGVAAKAATAATEVGTGAIATASATTAKAGMALPAGTLAGLGGAAFGIFGGYLGAWLPSQFAPTNTERLAIQKTAKRMLVVSIVSTVILLAGILILQSNFGALPMVTFVVAWMVCFAIYSVLEGIQSARQITRIRKAVSPESDPNSAFLRSYAEQKGWTGSHPKYRGRRYRSRLHLLGLPLVDIQVSSPQMGEGAFSEAGEAKGWIAIGDRATGLIAIGGIARGGIAIGGLAFGLASFGGVAIGVFALGGLGLGFLGIGGLGMGWNAAGGLAVGIHDACGGGAFAYHAACGGAGIAKHIAMGGAAIAEHANDDLAKGYWESHAMWQAMQWYTRQSPFSTIFLILAVLLPSFVISRLMYERVHDETPS